MKYVILLFLWCFSSQLSAQQLMPIEHAVLVDTSSFYYIDFDRYPSDDAQLPIGVFDSGTGGLTVLDAIVRFDAYGNGDQTKGGDGQVDFGKERFIYLADQANMPYGNYHSEHKTDLLTEHILKDVQFLLSDRYYPDAKAKSSLGKKQQIKALVIACNTATAYGKESIEAFLQKAGINIPVIGVIDAGARGALDVFGPTEDGSIGVFATVGTIASNGYERTILRIKNERGYSGDIQVYNQGGHGVAEAVDEEPDFINHQSASPRSNYRGPGLTHPDYAIDKALMDVYAFDFRDGDMLCDKESTMDCNILQLNSTENYIRYHLVSLMEQLRNHAGARPLKALLLGCTHYPYLTDEIQKVLAELYNYQRDGKYIYRPFMDENVVLIDPAENVSHELHAYLQDKRLFNPSGNLKGSKFFISVPNPDNPAVKMDSLGRFTYDYKYGRNVGDIQEYVKVVPFDHANIPNEVVHRMESAIPETFKLINALHRPQESINAETIK
ncbi:Asp/Glu/hydantoin racemase [Sphingobacterium alkalisoli]|uniref:Asp/Glu/hydantoin racemase n=1 Tax=Sphingobacterium alkalisoli TaxID=1874115 RepID=A0A4U0H8M6_9SPHI|nr:aspartate/glutamate racemase family protein [Sphingobacterium alkalisoli]TJY68106.1 Asp/Glu/hydantoin racemase [Sphingobacterium alkalisoli]